MRRVENAFSAGAKKAGGRKRMRIAVFRMVEAVKARFRRILSVVILTVCDDSGDDWVESGLEDFSGY